MWVAIRHRAAGSPSVYFGPFNTIDDLIEWAADNKLDVYPVELKAPMTPIPASAWA